jgi:hypothetical protein
VDVGGDATSVKLQGGGRTWTLPAKVPAGDYTVLASFGGATERPAGTVAVTPGASVRIVCKASFEVCRSE